MRAVTSFLGLGANLGDPRAQLKKACDYLVQTPGITLEHVSSFYVNPPMGPPDQPDYINAVVQIATTLSPIELLDQTQRIEQQLGRVKAGERWGPRAIDIDILLYADQQIELERLQVPHSGMPQRAFVLVPLAELVPSLFIPGWGELRELLLQCDVSGLKRIDAE